MSAKFSGSITTANEDNMDLIHAVVTGFGENPLISHFQVGFEEYIKTIEELTHVVVYENVRTALEGVDNQSILGQADER